MGISPHAPHDDRMSSSPHDDDMSADRALNRHAYASRYSPCLIIEHSYKERFAPSVAIFFRSFRISSIL